MGTCARTVLPLKGIDGSNVKFPVFVIDRSGIVRVERWSGIGINADRQKQACKADFYLCVFNPFHLVRLNKITRQVSQRS